MRILITGQEGFIGYHLSNNIQFNYPDYQILDYNKSFFNSEPELTNSISNSDIIIHLAGVNRTDNEQVLYDTNLELTKKLLKSIDNAKFNGKLIFASSTQESDNNMYGKSKKDSRLLFEEASNEMGFSYSTLVIPNVYGPFCKPNFNSFISTFSKNIICENDINIIKNNKVKLIFVNSLIEVFISNFNKKSENIHVKPEIEISVSEVKKILEKFKNDYIIKGIIPNLDSKFKTNLFITFLSYIEYESFYPKNYEINYDERGSFSELVRTKVKGQLSYSKTLPGVIRGNHFHTRKIERFSVIQGKAKIEIRKIGSNKKFSFEIDGNNPAYIDMPVWHTHNIKNIGTDELITIFWINEFYDKHDADTFYEKV